MKHLWQMLAASGALILGACANSPASLSPERDVVPANIVVPRIRESAGGQFEFDALGNRHYISNDGPIYPGDGSGNCYDVCDDGGGGTGGDGGGYTNDGGDGTPEWQAPLFTEAYFSGDIFKGHAEMAFTIADHATQTMTLTTSRLDGSTLGSQKFVSAKSWPVPVVLVTNMSTDGSMVAPKCGGRGQGVTIHEASATVKGFTNGITATSQSQIMNQTQCSTTSKPREEVTDPGSGGGVRICLRLDHYSSTGEYVYTETLYCYDVLNQT